MPKSPMPREECFRLLFGEPMAKSLDTIPLRDIAALAVRDDIESLSGLYPWDLVRLRAAVRFAELLIPAPHRGDEPVHVRGLADVVRLYRDRTRSLDMRTLWLLCLDETGSQVAEVLVHMGGRAGDLPPLRDLLRHVLLRGCAAAYIVDFRPLVRLTTHPPTARALRDLRELAELAGVVVHDWIILGLHDATSVADQLTTVAAEGRRRTAA